MIEPQASLISEVGRTISNAENPSESASLHDSAHGTYHLCSFGWAALCKLVLGGHQILDSFGQGLGLSKKNLGGCINSGIQDARYRYGK